MGLYGIKCSSCGDGFLWHSSMPQICSKCTERAGGGFLEVIEKINESVSTIHYIPNNSVNNMRIVLVEKVNGKTTEQQAASKILIDSGANKSDLTIRKCNF